MLNLKIKNPKPEIIAWLKKTYSDNFQRDFYNDEGTARIEHFYEEVKRLSSLADQQTSKEAQLKYKLDAANAFIEMMKANDAQGSKTTYAVIGMLLAQLSKHEEPQIPDEYWAFLDSKYEQAKRQNG